MEDLNFEIEKLKFELKMKRRSKAAFFLAQIAILVLLTWVFSKYFNTVWYWAFAKALGTIIVIGFIIMVVKFIKYVKGQRKAVTRAK